MPLMIVEDDATFTPPQAARAFTLETLSGPDRVVATADTGQVATLTVGARTVAISGGPRRTFTEAKRVGAGTADLFDRTRTARWGLSPFYGAWSSPVGGLDTEWTVSDGAARVLVNTANVSRYTSLRDQDLVDYRIRVPVWLTTMPTGASNSIALTGNYVDTSNHYRYRLTVTTAGVVQLGLDRVEGGSSVVVAASVQVGTGYAANQVWWIDAEQAPGGIIRAMAYRDGTAPPAGWQQTYTDPAPLGPGRVGVRAFTTTGATNNPTVCFGQFEIVSGRWSNPPVATHDTWVRVLPAPFTAWTPEVEAWLRAALVDSRPDILAYAMSYVTGSSRVYDAQYGADRWVLGQALYGPTNTDGSREEGSDWNDYVRTTGHYPNLSVPTDDINEIAQQGCLDCSGYVRMLWGYWHGVPMSLTDPADLNGVNLPRRAVHIGPSGPGVLVAVGTTAPPPLSSIQIGDVVAFNADTADDTAGDESGDVEATDDHVGVYLGRDQAGHYLFVSSRKTANGPSFAALGGSSFLDGTGFWATALRHIRRI